MRGPARRRRRASPIEDERGNVSILFALLLALGTVLGAFSVDEGALYLQRRQAQSAVDIAALAAAPDPAAAFARAQTMLEGAGLIAPGLTEVALQQGVGGVRLQVEAGHYSPDPTLAPGARFDGAAASANAVRVRLDFPGDLYFAQSWMARPNIGVAAVASATPTVMFSVGSTLAALQDGIPNAVLGALLGSNVQLTVASYNALFGARVNLFSFLDALAQQLGITAGSYGDVLAASADTGTLAKALALSLDGADAAAAQALAASLGHNGRVPLDKLVNLGRAAGLAIGSGGKAGTFATVSALEMLTAAAAVSDGTHQVALNLGANVPGLIGLTMTLSVGEPQQFATWFALGPSGTIVRTAQIRLRFVATIGGGASLLNAAIKVPLYLELASAEAGVTSARCPVNGATTGSAVIGARPGLARLVLGEVDNGALGDFSRVPAPGAAMLVDLGLLKVSGSGEVRIGDETATQLGFSATEIGAGTVKSASTRDFTQSLASSLLGTMTLKVSALGIGLPSTAAIQALVAGLIQPLGPVLDSTIATTLDALGVKLGRADVAVYGVTCGHAVLVG